MFTTLSAAAMASTREWVNAGAAILEKPLSLNPIASRMTNVALGVLNQDYIGDVNIIPERLVFNPLRLLGHRSPEEILELIELGQRATWPKLEQIRVQTKIGRKLDAILKKLDKGVISAAQNVTKRAS